MVGLTDQQKKAITEVIECRDKTMREFQSKNAEKLTAASKALGEAYQKNDKEAIAKAQKAYQEVYAPFHQAMKESQKKLDDILTPQQKEKQADHQMATWIKAYDRPDRAQRGAKAEGQDRSPRDAEDQRQRPWSAVCPDAIRKILTPQQQTALNKHRLGAYVKAMFARVKLTDEQNKKIEALLDKICQDPKLSVDWKTYQSVSKQVEELLTAEQKETLKKPMQFWDQAGGRHYRHRRLWPSRVAALRPRWAPRWARPASIGSASASSRWAPARSGACVPCRPRARPPRPASRPRT